MKQFLITVAGVFVGRTLHPVTMLEPSSDFGGIDAFGRSLFADALVPFELSSALLVVAVVGALAVARGRQGERGDAAMTVDHYILLSAILFTIGGIGFLSRRNVLVALMSLEVMLNAVNLALVAFNRAQAGALSQSSFSGGTAHTGQ